jgi:hypothetical protein
MRTDPRLDHRGPPEERYHAEQARQEAEVRGRHTDKEWSSLVGPLVTVVQALAIGRAVTEVPSLPAAFAPDLAEAWKTLAGALLEDRRSGLLEKADAVLADRLAAALAARPDVGPREWFQVAEVLERVGSALSYLDHISLDAIRAHEQELLMLPVHQSPLELIDTFSALREPSQQSAYLEELPARERSSKDRWEWLLQVERDADACVFRGEFWMQAHLLGRLGGRTWLRFVRLVPLTLLRQVAVRALKSLDEALELVGLALDEATDAAPLHEELVLLLIMRTLDLWNRIHSGLAHRASGRSFLTSEYPEFLARAKDAAKDWKDRELPERARALAARLLESGELGIRSAVITLRHLAARGSSLHEAPENETTPVIREAVLRALTRSGRPLSEIVQRILEPPGTKAGLIAACSVVVADEGAFSEDERAAQSARIWDCYGQHLQGEPYFFNGPLAGDEKELAEVLGGVLARLPSPADALQKMLASVRRPAEGWKVDDMQFFESIGQVAHLLIVGAMASHWLKQKGRESQPLFRAAWKYLHSWLRTVPEHVAADQVRSAIVHVWARLWLIEGAGATELAFLELSRLDRLDWVLTAAAHLRDNQEPWGGPDRLDSRLQHVLWRRFEEMFPVVRLHHMMTPERAAEYEEKALGLTPDVPHSRS